MIKTIFSFFQMRIERMFRYAIKFGQPAFCIAPERLNPVNVTLTIREFILTMINSKMLIKTNIDQAIITTPTIRMNNSGRLNMPPDNALQRGFGAVGNDLGINFTLPLQQSKYNCFSVSTSPTFTPDTLSPCGTTCTKIRFINFNCAFKRRGNFTRICHTLANLQVNTVYRSNRNTNQFGCARGGKIQRKTSNKLPEFSFTDSRTAIISIFVNHLSKLPHFKMCLTS